MAHELPKLPYEMTALEPHISRKTLEYHHGKHHQTYVTNLNNLLKDHPTYATLSLEEVIQRSFGEKNTSIFNNAAQVWNHTFYWHCMRPNGGGQPGGDLLALIHRDFGTYEAFREAFTQAALTQFGSGWAWLVLKDGKLSIMKTGNADLPMVHGAKALLTIDVWEHAYYIDYHNLRAQYINIFLDHLVNWDFVGSNMA